MEKGKGKIENREAKRGNRKWKRENGKLKIGVRGPLIV